MLELRFAEDHHTAVKQYTNNQDHHDRQDQSGSECSFFQEDSDDMEDGTKDDDDEESLGEPIFLLDDAARQLSQPDVATSSSCSPNPNNTSDSSTPFDRSLMNQQEELIPSSSSSSSSVSPVSIRSRLPIFSKSSSVSTSSRHLPSSSTTSSSSSHTFIQSPSRETIAEKRTHALNRLEVENAYLLNQNSLLYKDMHHCRETVQALKQILAQKEETINRMKEEYERACMKSRFMESILVEHTSNINANVNLTGRGSSNSVVVDRLRHSTQPDFFEHGQEDDLSEDGDETDYGHHNHDGLEKEEDAFHCKRNYENEEYTGTSDEDSVGSDDYDVEDDDEYDDDNSEQETEAPNAHLRPSITLGGRRGRIPGTTSSIHLKSMEHSLLVGNNNDGPKSSSNLYQQPNHVYHYNPHNGTESTPTGPQRTLRRRPSLQSGSRVSITAFLSPEQASAPIPASTTVSVSAPTPASATVSAPTPASASVSALASTSAPSQAYSLDPGSAHPIITRSIFAGSISSEFSESESEEDDLQSGHRPDTTICVFSEERVTSTQEEEEEEEDDSADPQRTDSFHSITLRDSGHFPIVVIEVDYELAQDDTKEVTILRKSVSADGDIEVDVQGASDKDVSAEDVEEESLKDHLHLAPTSQPTGTPYMHLTPETAVAVAVAVAGEVASTRHSYIHVEASGSSTTLTTESKPTSSTDMAQIKSSCECDQECNSSVMPSSDSISRRSSSSSSSSSRYSSSRERGSQEALALATAAAQVYLTTIELQTGQQSSVHCSSESLSPSSSSCAIPGPTTCPIAMSNKNTEQEQANLGSGQDSINKIPQEDRVVIDGTERETETTTEPELNNGSKGMRTRSSSFLGLRLSTKLLGRPTRPGKQQQQQTKEIATVVATPSSVVTTSSSPRRTDSRRDSSAATSPVSPTAILSRLLSGFGRQKSDKQNSSRQMPPPETDMSTDEGIVQARGSIDEHGRSPAV
ncbi:hypothetical protein BGX28_007977 [Mortierella sp. GBA30]|nr:hypothetical protein BGX28_007977 [Mortierella sp. GBA30]